MGSPWLPLGMGMGLGEPLRVGSLSAFYEDERTRHMPSLQPYPRPDAILHFPAPRALPAPHPSHLIPTATATASASTSASASGADHAASTSGAPMGAAGGPAAGDGEEGHPTATGAGVGGGAGGGGMGGVSSPMLGGGGMTSPVMAMRTPALNRSTRLFQSPTFSSPPLPTTTPH
jgi:hypothetical protein